eukprot:TRINITY_DN2953_c3_g1_i1.p1 TRINITY_DN2953_c3_g1~~TRINITY_DN2953_c3_g1_i1.p1  ORF type:complete len:473 (+),score=96.64 TRINITY_DN2953_c3_g1_i1:93-1511(+)
MQEQAAAASAVLPPLPSGYHSCSPDHSPAGAMVGPMRTPRGGFGLPFGSLAALVQRSPAQSVQSAHSIAVPVAHAGHAAADGAHHTLGTPWPLRRRRCCCFLVFAPLVAAAALLATSTSPLRDAIPPLTVVVTAAAGTPAPPAPQSPAPAKATQSPPAPPPPTASPTAASASPALAATVSPPPPPPPRLIAIGDLHGDWEWSLQSLKLAGVVNSSLQWAAGTDHLVQTGDIVDRGSSSLRLVWFVEQLKREAAASGGTVSTLLGNHELMNLQGDFRYAPLDELRALGEGSATAGQRRWAAQWGPTGAVGQLMRREREVVVAAGEGMCRSAFVHAGLRPAHLVRGREKDAADPLHGLLLWLRQALGGPGSGAQDERYRWLFGEDGTFWDRTHSMALEQSACPLVTGALKQLKAYRLVIGHTVQADMRTRCGGRLHLIDVGVSRAYAGRAAAWECKDGVASQIMRDGTRRRLDP